MATYEEALQLFKRAEPTPGLTGQAAIDPAMATPPKDFVTRNRRGDVPLRTDAHFPASVVAQTFWRRDTGDQQEFLRNYGYTTRMSDTGELIVGYLTDEGKQEDALFNARGLSREDLLEFVMGSGAEMLGGGVGAIKFGGGASIPGLLKTAVGAAVGAQAAGAGQDVLTRLGSEQGIRPGEIMTERLKRGMIDFSAAGIFAAMPRLAGKLISPFNNRGPIQFDSEAAEVWFRNMPGGQGLDEPFARTLGMSTGSPIIQQLEAVAERLPGARSVFNEIDDKAIEQITRLRDIAIGKGAVSRSDTGQGVIDILGAKTFQQEREIAIAAVAVERSGTTELSREAWRLSGMRGPMAMGKISRVESGQAMRQRAVADKESFEARFQGEYGAFEANPLVAARNLPLESASKSASELKERFPKFIVEEVEELGLLDKFGQVATVTKEKKKILPEFVPSKVTRFVNRIIEGKDQEMPFAELLAMRREVRNSISEAKAIPGVETHYLSEINGMLTKSIGDGFKAIDADNATDLFTTWKKINDSYAVGAKRYERAGIAELYRRPEKPPYVSDSEVVTRATRLNQQGADAYIAYKEFFGANSPEMATVKRGVIDDIMGEVDIGTGLVRSDSVLKRMSELYDKSPEIAEDIFGGAGGRFARIAEEMGVASGQVDAGKLLRLMTDEGPTTAKLVSLIAEQDKLNTLYRNKIMRAVGKSTPLDEQLNPHEFVSRFANAKETSPRDVAEIMSYLGTDPVTDDIRAIAAKDLFDKATAVSRGKDVVSGEKLKDLLYKDPDQSNIYKTILGEDRFEYIDKLARLIASRDIVSGGGGLAGPQQAASLIHSPLRAGLRASQNMLFAIFYTHPAFTKYLSNSAIHPTHSAIAGNYIAATAPFAMALQRLMGDNSEEMMRDIKAGIDERAIREAGIHAYQNRFNAVKELFDRGGYPAQPSAAPEPVSAPEPPDGAMQFNPATRQLEPAP